MSSSALVRQLASLVGADNVSSSASVRAAHAADKWFASREPDVVVFARSAEHVRAVLQFANRRGLPVT
ncbi:MAG: FAD/FMN-containing dehydrogenase, partial [Verrucomicrobiaceae bacterium]|nr:FAD/FMN-containing dehydrogenase [Verrucomicrobiaceae bacterium]